MSPFCFRFVFDEITNEWPDGFVVTNKKRRKPIPDRRWYHFTSAFFLSASPSGTVAGVCRGIHFQRRDAKIQKVFSGALALKTNTRTPCDAQVNKNWPAQSSGNHAKDPGHELATEKIHPSALPVTKGHAPEAVTLDLHRQAKNRQWPVFIFFEFLNFVLHATTYAGIRESAHFISIYIPRRMWGN